MFQFILNSIPVQQPEGWDTFTETLELDDTLHGVLPKYRSKLVFTGQAYEILKDIRDESGYCNTVTLEIKEDCSGNFIPMFTGLIFISDCQFTRDECQVECEVEDDSYSARINNNQKLLVNLASTRSKNGEAITAPTPIAMTFHDPAGGTFANTREVYDLKDVFEFMIAFLTDGNMTFESTFFDNLPDDEHLGILAGEELRTFGGVVPEIQFDDLMDEIHKKYNVLFTIEDDVFRLERETYYRNTTNSVVLNDIRGIKERFDNTKLYSKIKMGGDETEDFNAPTTNIPTIRFLVMNKEEFQIQSVCNIDRTLDLRSKWVIDTNLIEYVLNTPGDDQYDDETVIVQYTDSTNQTTGVDYLGLVVPINGFNDELRNINVAERFQLQGDIAFYIGDGNDECNIGKAGTEVVAANTFSEPVVFENQISDPNGNFRVPPEAGANPNYTYRAPANGLYRFDAILSWYLEANQYQNNNRTVIVDLKRYTAAAALVQTVTFPSIELNVTGFFSGVYGTSIYMDATDYLAVRLTFSSPIGADNVWIQGNIWVDGEWVPGSAFQCLATDTGAGVVQAKTPGDYFIGEYEFETCVSREDWNSIRDNIAQSINFGGIPNKRGWVKSIQHKYATGETEFQLLSNE